MMSNLEIGLRQQVAEMLAKADDWHETHASATDQPIRFHALGCKQGLLLAAKQLETFCNELFDA